MANFTSLPTAVRSVADAAELPWAHVLPYYRALQTPVSPVREAWMPKSVGRSIRAAEPKHIAPLLIALAMAPHPGKANEAVDLVARLKLKRDSQLSNNQLDHHSGTALEEIARFISQKKFADTINHILINRYDLTVTFILYQGDPIIYKFMISLDKLPGNHRPESPMFIPAVYIKGDFIRILCETIHWAKTEQPST